MGELWVGVDSKVRDSFLAFCDDNDDDDDYTEISGRMFIGLWIVVLFKEERQRARGTKFMMSTKHGKYQQSHQSVELE